MELFICIKMDLALINLQWLICHQTKPNQFSKLVVSNKSTGSMMSHYGN